MAYLNETGLAHFWEKIKSKIASSGNDTVNRIYPVGSVYVSTSSTSPASLFGGTWEQIQDKFLLAAGSTYGAGTTGGEATHKLTVNEMPTHGHNSNNYTDGFMAHKSVMSGTWAEKAPLATNTGSSESVLWVSQNPTLTGGGGYHNNMPPYLAVYAWKRVS